jgi:hypothetical protein
VITTPAAELVRAEPFGAQGIRLPFQTTLFVPLAATQCALEAALGTDAIAFVETHPAVILVGAAAACALEVQRYRAARKRILPTTITRTVAA